MDGLRSTGLRIVPIEQVRPHEIADPSREARIERRVAAEGILRDPVMVGAVTGLDGYVLLDGTNRTKALHRLGARWILAQVIEYADERAVQLQTWSHAAHLPLEQLLEASVDVPNTTVVPVPPLGVADSLRSPHTLAVLLNREWQHAIVRAENSPTSRAVQLRHLVPIYEAAMERIEGTAEDIEERGQQLADPAHPMTLVAFPPFTRSQVVTMAMRGTPIPAGITRHVVLGGRALRVNLPLDILIASETAEVANAALLAHLATLNPRMYQEATVLFDS